MTSNTSEKSILGEKFVRLACQLRVREREKFGGLMDTIYEIYPDESDGVVKFCVRVAIAESYFWLHFPLGLAREVDY